MSRISGTYADRTILIVDDQALIALNHARILEREGFLTQTVHSGEAAIKAVHDDADISLVLMDIDLGDGMAGTDAARALLAVRTLPVVFLTAHTEREYVDSVREISRYGYVIKNSGEFVLREAVQMAFELFDSHQRLLAENERRRETEAELRTRNEFIETLLANAPVGLAVNEMDSGIATYMNPEFERVYGWDRATLEDIPSFFEHVYPDPAYRHEMQTRIMNDIASGDPARMVWDGVKITTSSGEERTVRAVNIPVPQQNLMISTVTDVSRYAEAVARVEFQAELLEAVHQAVIATDLAGNVTYMNRFAESLYGWSRAEAIGKPVLQGVTVPEEGRDAAAEIMDALRRGETWAGDFTVRRRDGTTFSARVVDSALRDADGTVVGMVGISEDVSERVAEQEALTAAVAAREQLMAELNHRVKNNLAMVAALVSLKDGALGEAVDLSDIAQQIEAVRIIHEILYETGSISQIDLNDYLTKLLTHAFRLSPVQPVHVDATIPAVHVSTRTATTMGLIVNELATNAMKHGFAAHEAARFSVEVRETDAGIVLEVRNSGRPVPAEVNIEDPDSLGLRVLRSLIEQLNGTLSLTRTPSAHFTITVRDVE